ncbi:SPRY-domain-containing protein, partial [Martensiomyces pterosporus]
AAGSGTKPSDTADEGQDLPTEWHPLCESSRMTIGPDRLSVQYTGPGRQDADAAQVQANNCIPARSGVYYFELHIKSRGQSGYIGIGLSLYGIGAHRLPGWDEGSWGYHGDDGNSFGGDGHGHPYGPGFTTGDTVGCGIDFMLRRIFFTRNGFFLGYAFKDIDISKDLYPCVGMRTPGEHVVANFGHKAFAYDIDHYVSEAHDSALVAVSATGMDTLQISRELLHIRDGELGTVPHGSDIATSDATLSIILSHLLDNEHYATARALIENIVGRSSSEAAARNERLADILKVLGEQDLRRAKRKRICRYICEGDIDYSLGLLQESYPQVLEDESLVFQLRCRQFIELLASTTAAQETAASAPMGGRDKHEKPAEDMMDVDDTKSPSMMSLAAITNAPNTTRGAPFGQIKNLRKMEPAQLVRVLLEYGRQLQADYGSSPNPIIREGLVHTFSLLAYADPAQSPIYALLDPEACKPLARLVELAVIASEKEPRASSLERIYRQTSVLLNELSAGRNGAASLISIERDFL